MAHLKLLSSFNVNGETYNDKFLQENKNEETLHHLLFSKFSIDEIKNTNNQTYINYIIKNKQEEYYKTENISQRIQVTETNPYGPLIYASDEVKEYGKYILWISNFYNSVYSNNNILSKTITINGDTIKIIRNNANTVIDIEGNISNSFKKDILEHITDMEKLNIKDLPIFVDFYNMCGKYLYYLILNSIKLHCNDQSVKQKIDDIYNSTKSTYIDFLNNINSNTYVENVEDISNNIKTGENIQKVSEEMKRDYIDTNTNIRIYQKYTMDYEYKRNTTYFAYILLSIFIVCVISIFILRTDSRIKLIFSISSFILVLILYVFAYSGKRESFQNDDRKVIEILKEIRKRVHKGLLKYVDKLNDKKVKQHIDDTKREINNNKQRLNHYNEKINTDKNLRKLDNSEMEYSAHIAFQLILVICMIILFHNYTNDYIISIILFLICIIAIVTIYNANIMKMVRTSADKIYWGNYSANI